MARKIATLYAEIGADTAKLKQGLRETKDGLEKTKQAMDDIKKAVATTTAVLAALGIAFKAAYDVGKQGAQLEYMRSKFDKLSASIGTTGDVLLGDLRTATRGMRTDADLVASAADFMALGFAKTREEAVRLTKVAGALNMDMNQLVLTLANQTTMRFDQLGVSVDGFKERVDKLKRAGMDANAAFKEAFLQQAEEQIRKVGDAADSSVAAFNQLEVSITNMGDAFKKDVAPTATGAAKILNSVAKAVQRYDEATQLAKQNLPAFIAENETLIGLYAFGLTRIQEMTAEREHEAQQLRQLPDVYNNAKAAVQGLSTATAEATDEIKQQASALRSDLVDAVLSVREAEKDWMKSTGQDVADALKESGLEGDKYREVLGLIDDVYNTSLGVQQDYKDDVANLARNYSEGKLTGDEFKRSLQEIKETYMPLNEQVQKANDLLWNLQLKWKWFQQNNRLNLEVNIAQNGNLPTTGASGGATSSKTTSQNPSGGTSAKPGEVKKEAVGGAVSAGNMYTWNEPRNEMFVPSGNGYILSKRDAQDRVGGNITIHIHGNVDSQDTARKYAQYTAQYLRRRA